MNDVVLPGTGRPMSDFVKQVADEINQLVDAKTCHVCVRHGLTGKLEARENKKYFKAMEFHPMSPEAAITDLERYVRFVTPYKVPKSLNRSQTSALLASPDLKDKLYHLTRIFEFPIPIRQLNGTISMLKEGFNTDSKNGKKAYYCGPPIHQSMKLLEAKGVIDYIFKDFDFDPTHPASRTHAIARLLTPYCQGIMGFHAKSPLWIFQANRSRAGKDYCAAVAPLVFGGIAHEDAPLDRDDSENKRRITSAIIAGHRFMHFANCKLDLDQCQTLEAAVTSKFWHDRVVGTSETVSMSNEIIYSLSYNGAYVPSDDIANRTRRIKFFLDPTVKANEREFPFDLHGWLASENGRRKVIAAIHALVENWKSKKMLPGSVVFTSFPEWGEVIGGIMEAAGYDSPCGEDPEDHKSVVRTWDDDICYLTDLIGKAEPTAWFQTGDIVSKFVKKDPQLAEKMGRYKNETSFSKELGQKLKASAGKDLGGGLKIDLDLADQARPKFKFTPPIKNVPPRKSATESKSSEPQKPTGEEQENDGDPYDPFAT